MEKKHSRERAQLAAEYTPEHTLEDAREAVSVAARNWADFVALHVPVAGASRITAMACEAMGANGKHGGDAATFDLFTTLARLELPDVDADERDARAARESATRTVADHRAAQDIETAVPSLVETREQLRRAASRHLAFAQAAAAAAKWKGKARYPVSRRRAAIGWLRHQLNWTHELLADLILASSKDWTVAPCPRFVRLYDDKHGNDSGRGRLIATIAKDLQQEESPKK